MRDLCDFEREMLTGFRRCAVCIIIERIGLTKALVKGGMPASMTPTVVKTLAAAEILNVVERVPEGFRWATAFLALARDPDRWQRFLRLVLHQASYLSLADSILNPPPPINQATDSTEYRRFLEGVAASHVEHARNFAACEELATVDELVDVGSGIGVFSRAWIESRATRTATCIDLPQVIPLVRDALASPRAHVVGADLNSKWIVPRGQVYLVANVLHLLPRWRSTVEHIAKFMSADAVLVIMEADPTPPSGKLFDLQVHLRGGRSAGLIEPAEIIRVLNELGMSTDRRVTNPEPADPFERTYHWWFARHRITSEVSG
jgi:hypothetical protein